LESSIKYLKTTAYIGFAMCIRITVNKISNLYLDVFTDETLYLQFEKIKIQNIKTLVIFV